MPEPNRRLQGIQLPNNYRKYRSQCNQTQQRNTREKRFFPLRYRKSSAAGLSFIYDQFYFHSFITSLDCKLPINICNIYFKICPGQNYFFKRLATRIVAGTWCCGCFFLVQIYCCTLMSHLTAPNQKPLVNSFFEIADNSGVTLTVDRGYGVDKVNNCQDNLVKKRNAVHNSLR